MPSRGLVIASVVSAILTALAAGCASSRSTMRGGGVEIAANLSGWQALPSSTGRLRDNYFLLGLLARENGQVLSILADDAPAAVTHESLCEHERASFGRAGTVVILDGERVAGRPACWFTFVADSPPNRNVFVVWIADGKSIYLHYSAPETSGALRRGRSTLESILASLSVRRRELGTEELTADVPGAVVLPFMRDRLACLADRESLFCRALDAFAAGHRPAGRPDPVGMAGVAATVPGVGAPFDGKPVVTAVHLVLQDGGARMGPFPDQVEAKDLDELVQAIVSGTPVPSGNGAVTYARTLRELRPAEPAARSLVWGQGQITRYVRDTRLGPVVLEVGPERFMLALFPSLPSVADGGVVGRTEAAQWEQQCAAQLTAAASANPAFKMGKLVERHAMMAELRVEFPGKRLLVAGFGVKDPGPPATERVEWSSAPRSNDSGFTLFKAVDGRQVMIAGTDAHDPLREDFEKTFKPTLEKCLR